MDYAALRDIACTLIISNGTEAELVQVTDGEYDADSGGYENSIVSHLIQIVILPASRDNSDRLDESFSGEGMTFTKLVSLLMPGVDEVTPRVGDQVKLPGTPDKIWTITGVTQVAPNGSPLLYKISAGVN